MTPERRKEIIEALKINRVPYYLWTQEERAVADEIPRKWFHSCAYDNGISWDDMEGAKEEDAQLGARHSPMFVYRLKPEYEPEPESRWEEREIVMNAVGLWRVKDAPSGTTQDRFSGWPLHEATILKGFGGIMYEDCACESMADAGMTGKFHMAPPEPCEKCGPHEPLKVRFWRSKA